MWGAGAMVLRQDNTKSSTEPSAIISIIAIVLALALVGGVLALIFFGVFMYIPAPFRVYGYAALALVSLTLLISAYLGARKESDRSIDEVVDICANKVVSEMQVSKRLSMPQAEYLIFLNDHFKSFRFFPNPFITIGSALLLLAVLIALIAFVSLSALSIQNMVSERDNFEVNLLLVLDAMLKGAAVDAFESFSINLYGDYQLSLSEQTILFFTRLGVSVGIIGALAPSILSLRRYQKQVKLTSTPDFKIKFFAFIDRNVRGALSDQPERGEGNLDLINAYEQVVFPLIWDRTGVNVSVSIKRLFDVFRAHRNTRHWFEPSAIQHRTNGLWNNKNLEPSSIDGSERLIDFATPELYRAKNGVYFAIGAGFIEVRSFEYSPAERELYIVFKNDVRLPLGAPIGSPFHEALSEQIELIVYEFPDRDHPGSLKVKPLIQI